MFSSKIHYTKLENICTIYFIKSGDVFSVEVTCRIEPTFSSECARRTTYLARHSRHSFGHTDHSVGPIVATISIKPKSTKFLFYLRSDDLGNFIRNWTIVGIASKQQLSLRIFPINIRLDLKTQSVNNIVPTVTTVETPAHGCLCHRCVAIPKDLRILLAQFMI